MCCGEAFWKRVLTFSLTFGLGVFVAGLFVAGQVSQTVKPLIIPAAENKNCVPIDENLKYERLTTEEKNISDNSKEVDPQLKAKKREVNKKSLPAEKENNSELPRSFNPSKDSAEVKYLVHKERCFETPVE